MASYDHLATLNAAITAFQAGDKTEAARLCQIAVKQRSEDAESWSFLGLALPGVAGLDALQKAVTLEPHEPRWHLHLGAGYVARGEYASAEPAYAKASELSRGHPEPMKAWGHCLLTLERFGQAAQVFQKVLQVQPSTEIWMKAGDALVGANDTINAAKAYERAHIPDRRPVDMSARLADLHIYLNQYDEAQIFNDAVLKQTPDDPDAGLRAANLLRWRGDHMSALEVQQSFWSKNPQHSGLIAALLDDKDDAVLDAAKSLASDKAADITSRRRVCFALARYFDRQDSESVAWKYAVVANSLYDDGLTYDGGEAHREQLTQALAVYKTIGAATAKETKMIYVIGPPRCGGSLIQTILSQAEGVVSVGERGALMGWIIPSLRDLPRLRSLISQLGASDLAGMARAAGPAKIYVDKTSPHIIVAGLLARIHPGTQFVLPRRNHDDMIVSMFFHDFPPEFSYTRSVQGISNYLAFQSEAAEAWQKAGLTILDHNHDDFTEDPENYGKALFDALGLPWSSNMLNTSSSDTVVRTFSARQVRGGVSKKFAGRGERYAKYLR